MAVPNREWYENADAHRRLLQHVLAFLAARGVTVHPFDWLPGEAPDALPPPADTDALAAELVRNEGPP